MGCDRAAALVGIVNASMYVQQDRAIESPEKATKKMLKNEAMKHEACLQQRRGRQVSTPKLCRSFSTYFTSLAVRLALLCIGIYSAVQGYSLPHTNYCLPLPIIYT